MASQATSPGPAPAAFPLPLDHTHLQKLATADLVRPDHLLGAHPVVEGGVSGVRFAVWAPQAQAIHVVGDFNGWQEVHLLERLDLGYWGTFVPGAQAGQLYKFRIHGADGRTVDRIDPYARAFEAPPATASVIWTDDYAWDDAEWMANRSARQSEPVSIYEVHVGSWRYDDRGQPLAYRELAHALADHVQDLGFTHVELMGVMAHPFYGSWGYQVTGYYAPEGRQGTPEDFKYLVDHLHGRGIGVILDWVPGHFPTDDHALAHYDGAPLYEYADPRKGFHYDWNTHIFDYGRNEVVMFLIGSALRWLQDFHVDGLRVDAVASMLYLDFSREEWMPNIHGGRENLEAIAFLKRLNEVVHHMAPGCMMVAEESTAFPGVTHPTPDGLGFDYKWAMGWMNDSLAYLERDPIYRQYDHHKLTFFNVYRSTEHFVLAISHDEVVHGKKPLVLKAPGDWEQQRANLRAFYAYMWTTPGKKLLFMGQEFAHSQEWNHDAALPWERAAWADHAGVKELVRDLNRLYTERPDWYAGDTHPEGLQWLNADDAENSVYIYRRVAAEAGRSSVIVLNMTPMYRRDYHMPVPEAGAYRLLLNTDSGRYGGWSHEIGELQAWQEELNGQPARLSLHLPPLSALVLERVGETQG
ncbi:1,4-alpha-glucan branching protein GlgB [Deinococcus radiophilus]|uniref:1,4-alpha-glucan branching enzyme GlgB n=1 Tax=Deinococcus radiophilus TaxID=32062 RepID=A0A3S0JTJ4_9DEIO|nr:1,4-alpha-glucan branching protein GlgB [Deinococcus radiophilus]RTR28666.1 1,4-alpha-glucan branching protein GlgB [Deinococcus radiophilus]UFA51089.1 1,4-alpha-glucan branching protein GlgB [Deinococcus radiophilus]